MSIGRRAEWLAPFLGRKSPIYRGNDLGYANNAGPQYWQDYGVGGRMRKKKKIDVEDFLIKKMQKAKKKRAVKKYIEGFSRKQARVRNELLAQLLKKARGGARTKRKHVTSPWIRHVKAFARQHGLTYGEALKKARASYYR